MSRSNIRLDAPQQKEIYKNFRYLSDRYGKWEAWSDFIRLSACSLCVSDRDEKEREYTDITKRYRQCPLFVRDEPRERTGAVNFKKVDMECNL